MQNSVNSAPQIMTQLVAISVAKVLTIVILVGYTVAFGICDFRQLLYCICTFVNPTPPWFGPATIALVLYIFGSLSNTSADVQKLTVKQWGAELVSDEI